MNYHLTYSIQELPDGRFEVLPTARPEGIARAEIPKGSGATDALIMVSLIYPPDGSLSTSINTMDGRTSKPLEANEVFKAWLMMALQLSNDRKLPEGKRDLCRVAFETVASSIRRGTP